MVSIFFDLDGVLCHFVRGVLKKHSREDVPIMSVPWGLEAHLAIEPVLFWGALDREFTEALEPYEDGMALLRHAESLVGPENIGILTSPWNTPGCWEGKKAWVTKHLPGYERRLFTGAAKELFAGPTKILIDDRNENVYGFVKAGGYGILVPRPWNDDKANCLPDGSFDVEVLKEYVSEDVETATKIQDRISATL